MSQSFTYPAITLVSTISLSGDPLNSLSQASLNLGPRAETSLSRPNLYLYILSIPSQHLVIALD